MFTSLHMIADRLGAAVLILSGLRRLEQYHHLNSHHSRRWRLDRVAANAQADAQFIFF